MNYVLSGRKKLHFLGTSGTRPNNNQPSRPEHTVC